MPSTRSQSQSAIQFPKTKNAKVKTKDRLRTKSETGATLTLSPVSKVLPLSPRKRLGDDNLCNIPQSNRCSPPKLSRGENGPQSPAKGGRRLIFDQNQATVTPPSKKGQDPNLISPQKRGQETPSSTSQHPLHERASVCTQLFKQEGTCYQQVKSALNTAVPERLLTREKETSAILSFLKTHVSCQKPGSLYISGAPGTGKTACLSKLLQENKETLKDCKTIYINCMSLRSSQAVFPAIAEEISGTGKSSLGSKDIVRNLEKQVTSKGPIILLVLDEMDQLDSKGQDVLYTVFEWPWLPNSRVVLIGIANALDLTDRILPRLQARPNCRPQLLNFSPYTKDQIATILQDRLAQASGDPVLDNAAIQFCARKVSAVSGDARKALDICRRAVEIVESDVRSQTVLKPLSQHVSPAKEVLSSPVPKKVSLPHISRVLSDVYGDKMAASGGGEETFPLQQKLVVCSLLLLTKEKKMKEVTLGKLHEAYSKVCRKQQMAAVGQSECLSLCQLLETRGILGLKRAKEARLTKVSLKIEERDIEHAFKDKVLIGNVLHAGI